MTNCAEKLCVLSELGPGLLHRLFTIKKDLETNEKNEILRPTTQNKSLFARITKSDTLEFPEDIEKVIITFQFLYSNFFFFFFFIERSICYGTMV